MTNSDTFDSLNDLLKPMNTVKDVARIGINETTLAYWRHNGLGPKYVKAGRIVLYPKEEIITYLRDHLYQSTSEYEETLQ